MPGLAPFPWTNNSWLFSNHSGGGSGSSSDPPPSGSTGSWTNPPTSNHITGGAPQDGSRPPDAYQVVAGIWYSPTTGMWYVWFGEWVGFPASAFPGGRTPPTTRPAGPTGDPGAVFLPVVYDPEDVLDVPLTRGGIWTTPVREQPGSGRRGSWWGPGEDDVLLPGETPPEAHIPGGGQLAPGGPIRGIGGPLVGIGIIAEQVLAATGDTTNLARGPCWKYYDNCLTIVSNAIRNIKDTIFSLNSLLWRLNNKMRCSAGQGFNAECQQKLKDYLARIQAVIDQLQAELGDLQVWATSIAFTRDGCQTTAIPGTTLFPEPRGVAIAQGYLNQQSMADLINAWQNAVNDLLRNCKCNKLRAVTSPLIP